MFTLTLLLQLAAVDSAAQHNRAVPPTLQSYRAHVESEIGVLLRRGTGIESAVQVEQTASTVQWTRSGEFEQHVQGYRAQLSAFGLSALSYLKNSWIVPVLYGNRLNLLFGVDTSRAATRKRERSGFFVTHPFAPNRDSIYRFSGGDTVVTLRLPGGRQVPVVRVHVEPRDGIRQRSLVFRGDIDLDATRWQIVRMRGVFGTVGGHSSIFGALGAAVLKTMFVVDITAGEFDGAYWLPTVERIEGQTASPFGGDARTTLRVVSTFSAYVVHRSASAADTTLVPTNNPTNTIADTLAAVPHRLTYAPSDSMSGYTGWTNGLGAATAQVGADDYLDLAPGYWRPNGGPRIDPRVDRFGDFFRFDRVEGLFTGFGAAMRFRDAVPGLVVSAHGGWAWTEKTARGGAAVTWNHGPWTVSLGASRLLDNTNDFRTVFMSGPTIEALFAQDDYDYVDRRVANAVITHVWGPDRNVIATLTVGAGDDQGERRRLTRPPIFPYTFVGDSLFRPNRPVTAGSYTQVAATLEINPDVDIGFVAQGVGARFSYQWADGTLAWQRAEGRVIGRRFVGPLVLAARADGGIVTGSVIPTQQLFEIGTFEGLTAYNYKEFGGDRAVVLQSEVGYNLPFLRSPLRINKIFLPAIAPELAVGVRSGWTEAGTAAGRQALLALGRRVDPATDTVVAFPASVPSDGFRTSVDFLVRTFGGALGIGAARALDGRAAHPGWTAIVLFGSSL